MTYSVGMNPYLNNQQTGYASSLGLSSGQGYSDPINMLSGSSSAMGSSMDPYAMYLQQTGTYDALASAYPTTANPYASQGAVVSSASPSFGGGESYQDPYSMMGADYYSYEPDPSTNGFLVFLGLAGHVWQKWNYLAGPDAIDNTKFDNTYEHNKKFNGITEIESAGSKSVLDELDPKKVTSEDFTRLLEELKTAKAAASTNFDEFNNQIKIKTTPATSLVYGSDLATNKQLAEIELNRYLADMQESLMVSKAGSADIKAAQTEINKLRSALYSQLNTIQNDTDLKTFIKNLVNAETTSKYLATSNINAQNLHNLHTLDSTPANWHRFNDVHYVLIDSTRFNNWNKALFDEQSASPSGLFPKSDWTEDSQRQNLANAIVDSLKGKSPTPEIASGNRKGWNTAMNHLRSILTDDFGLAPATLRTMPEEQIKTLVKTLVDANFDDARPIPQAITSASPGSVGVVVRDDYTLLGISPSDYNTLKQITPQPLESRGLNPSINLSTVTKKDWSSLNLSNSYSLFSKAPTATARGHQIPMNDITKKATTYATEAEAKWAADEIYRIFSGASPADHNFPNSANRLNEILDSISPAARDKVPSKLGVANLEDLRISTDSHAPDRVLSLKLNYQDSAEQQALVLRDWMLHPVFKLTKDIKEVITNLCAAYPNLEDQLKDGIFMLSAEESSQKLSDWANDSKQKDSLHKIVDALPEKVQNDIKQKLGISNLDNDIIQQKLPLIQQILADNAAEYNKVIGIVDSDGNPIKAKMPAEKALPETVKLGESFAQQPYEERLKNSQFFADAARETVYSTLLEREYMVAKRNKFNGTFTEYLAQQEGKSNYIKTSHYLAQVESQDLTDRWQTVRAAEEEYRKSFATAPADYDNSTSWQFDEMTATVAPRNKLSATDRALIAQRTNTSSMQDDYDKYTKVNKKLNSLTGGTSDLLDGNALRAETKLHLTTHPAADLDNARLLANYYSLEEDTQQQIRTILGVSSAEMPDLVMKAQDSVQEAIQQTALEHKKLTTKLQQTARTFKDVAVDEKSALRKFDTNNLTTTLDTMKQVQTAKANTGKKVGLINAIQQMEATRTGLVEAVKTAQTAWENYKNDASISTPKSWDDFLKTEYAKNAGIEALTASATSLGKDLTSETDLAALTTFVKQDTPPTDYSAVNSNDTDLNSLKSLRGTSVADANRYAKLIALKNNFTLAYDAWKANDAEENRTTLEAAANQLKKELHNLDVKNVDNLVDYNKGIDAINDFYEHHNDQTKWQAYIKALDAFKQADESAKTTKLDELNTARKAVGINDNLKYDSKTKALTASSDNTVLTVSDLTTQAQTDLKISRNFVNMESFEKVENARTVLKDTFDIADVTKQNEILSKIAENKQSLATILIDEGFYTQKVYELAMKELAITNADFTTNRLETEKARWQMLDEAAKTKGTTRQIAADYFAKKQKTELAFLVQKAENGDAMAQKLLRQGLKQGHITPADITMNRATPVAPVAPLTPLTLKGLSLNQKESFTYLFDFNDTFKDYLVEDANTHKLSLSHKLSAYDKSTAKKGDTIAYMGTDSKWYVGTATQDHSNRLDKNFITTSVGMPKGTGDDFEFKSHKQSLDRTLEKLNAIRQMLLANGVPATQLGNVINDLATAGGDFTSAKNWNDIIQKRFVPIRPFTDVDAINKAIADSATLKAPEKRTIIIDGKEVKITLMPGMSDSSINAALKAELGITADVDNIIKDYQENLKKSRGFVGQSDSLPDARKLDKAKNQKYTYMGQTIELDLSKIADVSQLSQNDLDTAIQNSLAAKGGDFVIDGKQFHIAQGSKAEDIAKLMMQMQETAKNVTEENYLKQIGIEFKDGSGNRTLDFEGWKKQAVANGSVVYYQADDRSIKKVETFADLQKAINNAKEVANKKYKEKLKNMSSTTATEAELNELETLKQAAAEADKKWQEANQLASATDEAKINFVKEQLAAESKTKTTPQTTGANTEIEEVTSSKAVVSPMNSLLQDIDSLRKQLQALEKTEGADQDLIKALRESLAEKSAEFEKQKGEYRSALATAMSQGDNAKKLDGILREAFQGKTISTPEDAFAIVKNLQANPDLANQSTGKALLSLMECDQDFFNEIKNKAVAGGDDIISASLKKGSTSFVAPKTFGANFSKEIAVDLQNKGDWAVTGVQAVGSIALAAYNEYQATGQVGEATVDAAVVGTAEAVGAKLGGDGAGSLVRAGLAAAGKSGNGWALLLSAGATILGGFLGTKLLGGIAKDAVKD